MRIASTGRVEDKKSKAKSPERSAYPTRSRTAIFRFFFNIQSRPNSAKIDKCTYDRTGVSLNFAEIVLISGFDLIPEFCKIKVLSQGTGKGGARGRPNLLISKANINALKKCELFVFLS